MSPRLKPGETAPGITNLKNKKQKSISAIYLALNEANKDPSNANKVILEAARTQSGLENLNIPEKQICDMSPTTFKKHCNAMFPRGFDDFKELREEAYSKYCKYHKKLLAPGVNSKEGLSEQLREATDTYDNLLDSVVEFSFMYMDLYKVMKDLAPKNAVIKKRFEEHILRFSRARNGLHLVVSKK